MTEVIPVGSHLITPRKGYDHHGIYIGRGMVVHYAGLANGLSSGPVEETTLDDFASGRGLQVLEQPTAKFGGKDIAERARERIGEDRYHVIFNNCEHFCNWCINDVKISKQVQRGVTAVGSFIASRYLVGAGTAILGGASAPLTTTVATAVVLGYGVNKLADKWNSETPPKDDSEA